jgi:hypothetical protein
MRGKFSLPLLTIVIIAFALAVSDHTTSAAPGVWENVTGNLSGMASECGNITLMATVPSSSSVLAGIALKGLWSNSSGTTWTHLGDSAGSDTIANRPSWIVFDPVNPAKFWESGIYNVGSGGVFKTTDAGNTFKRLGSISHNDYVSVDFTDPNRQVLLAGGHEQVQTVFKSTDGGQTWNNIGVNLPANTNHSTHPLVINTQTYVVNTQGWAGGTSGIFRTTNGGTSWQQVHTVGPAGPPLVTSTGAIYWPTFGSLAKSTNGGASWTQVGNGLLNVTPVELPDGKLATAGGTTLLVSADGGVTWTPIGVNLPYQPQGVIYSPGRRAFFVWKGDCGNVVPANAVMKLDLDMGGGTTGPPVPAAPQNLRVIR